MLTREQYQKKLRGSYSKTTKDDRIVERTQRHYLYYYDRMVQETPDFFNCDQKKLLRRMKAKLKLPKYETNIVLRSAFIHMLEALEVERELIDELPDVKLRKKTALTSDKLMLRKRKFAENAHYFISQITDKRMLVACAILLETGIRRNELMNIKPKNIEVLKDE